MLNNSELSPGLNKDLNLYEPGSSIQKVESPLLTRQSMTKGIQFP